VSDFRARLLSALILGPLVLVALVLGGWIFTLLIAVVVAMAGREWARMIGGERYRSVMAAATVVPAVVATILVPGWPIIGAALALLAGAAGVVLALVRKVEGPLWFGFGVPYVVVGAGAVLWLRELPVVGLELALYLVVVVWGADIGAYAAGRTIGGPKLWPRVSPKKTWAGLFGGMVAAGVLGAGVSVAYGGPVLGPLMLGAVLAAIGQGGDLFESAMKRRSHVKDSGSLIPGHGGILDRIDAMLVAAPALVLVHLLSGGTLPWPG
jgi:phosphatidate cytidylyltransferase